MEAGLKQTILLKRKRNLLKLLPKWKLIGEKSTAEILLKLRPDLRKILVNESGIFYKINIIFCAELSAKNCRAELSNAELSAPNCPRRIVRAELSCAELSGHRTNSLSSLHIFVHHCTFCASLHTKTSPDQTQSLKSPTQVTKITHPSHKKSTTKIKKNHPPKPQKSLIQVTNVTHQSHTQKSPTQVIKVTHSSNKRQDTKITLQSYNYRSSKS